MASIFDYNSYIQKIKNEEIKKYYSELYNYDFKNAYLMKLIEKYTENNYLKSSLLEYINKNYNISIEKLWNFYYVIIIIFNKYEFNDNDIIQIEKFYTIIFNLIMNIIDCNEKNDILFGNTTNIINEMILFYEKDKNVSIIFDHTNIKHVIMPNHIRLYYFKIYEKLKNLKNLQSLDINNFLMEIYKYKSIKLKKEINDLFNYIHSLKDDNKDKIIEINEILIYFIKIFNILLNNNDNDIIYSFNENDLIISNFRVLLTFLLLYKKLDFNIYPQIHITKKTQYIDLLEIINNELKEKQINEIDFIEEIIGNINIETRERIEREKRERIEREEQEKRLKKIREQVEKINKNTKNQPKNTLKKWLSGLYNKGGNINEFINYKLKNKIYKRKIRYDEKNKKYIIINKKKIYI